MDLSFTRLIKADKPGADNRRIYCNDDGVFIGPDCPLIRVETDCVGHKSYKARPRSEIAHLLDAGYGFHLGLNGFMRSLNVIAKALNHSDLTLAWIATLQLGLPELADGEAVRRMASADRLLKANFNPDEPRDSHGRWTAGEGAGADLRPQLAQNAQSPAAARAKPSSHIHFSRWDQLSPMARRTLTLIGERYYRRTGITATVTSGRRTPQGQAQVMYDNLRRNVRPLYRNRGAYAQIEEAYNDAAAAGASQQVTVNAMTRVIEQQVSRGIYISDHLTGNAVDIRSRDMSDEQQRAFEEAVDGVLGPHHWIAESDHYHVRVR